MDIILTIVIVLLGLAVGSFLNVCIDRLPSKGSLTHPPSRCDGCQKRLTPLDLIPVFSYLWLRGRCRYCGAHIPARVLLVEVLTATLFFLAFWRFGPSAWFAITALWSCVFLVIMFIDWEHKLILNRVTYPAILLSLVILAVDTVAPGLGLLSNLFIFPEPSLLGGIIGGGAGFIFFFMIFLINPRGMGMGDIKLAALIGLVTGFPLVIIALFIGIFLGGIVAVILLVTRVKSRKDVIPYGTFLAIGPIIAMLWGQDILLWYLGFF